MEVRVDDLPPRDRLLHAIGHAAQENAVLENSVAMLWQALVGDSNAIALVGTRRMDVLLDECKVMLERMVATPPMGLFVDGVRVVSAVRSANEQRHRAVHDMWFTLTPDDGPVELLRHQRTKKWPWMKTTPASLVQVQDIVVATQRAWTRVNALTMAVWAATGRAQDVVDLDWCWQVIADRFDMAEGGGVAFPPPPG
jgi:hypothetical protein